MVCQKWSKLRVNSQPGYAKRDTTQIGPFWHLGWNFQPRAFFIHIYMTQLKTCNGTHIGKHMKWNEFFWVFFSRSSLLKKCLFVFQKNHDSIGLTTIFSINWVLLRGPTWPHGHILLCESGLLGTTLGHIPLLEVLAHIWVQGFHWSVQN